MRKLGIIITLILCLALVSSLKGITGAADEGVTYPIMRLDQATLERWIEAYDTAPLAHVEMKAFGVPSPGGSQNLLSHLQYVPGERNQGSCTNCWAWAGTGVMEVALDVQEGIKDRLSVQYINSCEFEVIGKSCCDGGSLSDLASFYNYTGMAIPWSNDNAEWQDHDASCGTDCGTISTTPNYPISSVRAVTILTQPVDQATAIANIKNVLDQNKAVWFVFYLPNASAWKDFFAFWLLKDESVVYDMDQFCGIPYDPVGGGGHAVLCVGYNDEDPENSYWIMLNSWGKTLGRPNGLFRIDMDMAYDGINSSYYSFYWQTLDVTFAPTPTPIPLGEAVDNTALSWTTGGNANWFGQTTTSYYGGDAAQSGVITDNRSTWLRTTVTGPGTLTFYWKVSSETNYDFLRFKIDGTLKTRISGSVDWQQKSYSIPSGTHTLEWRYTKNGSVNSGSDCGWVDKVGWVK